MRRKLLSSATMSAAVLLSVAAAYAASPRGDRGAASRSTNAQTESKPTAPAARPAETPALRACRVGNSKQPRYTECSREAKPQTTERR